MAEYRASFQHPDTGYDVEALYAFGKIILIVPASETPADDEAYLETITAVAPYRNRRCGSADAAAQVMKDHVAKDQWEGWE